MVTLPERTERGAMMRRSPLAVLMAVAVVFPGHLLLAGDGQTWKQVRALGEKPNSTQARDLVDSLRTTRKQSVVELIAVSLNDELSRHTRVSAVAMLGDLRAPEAVDSLMGQLTTLLPPEGVITNAVIGAFYPCAGALVRIGKPASSAARRQLGKEDDQQRRGLLCFIVHRVEGEAIGRLLLEHQRDRTRDEATRRNLQAALDTHWFTEERE